MVSKLLRCVHLGLMLTCWAWSARMLVPPIYPLQHSMLWPAACPTRHASLRGRWDGGNGPEQSDFVAVRNLLAATPRSVRRFVLTTSAGVERQGKFPFVILNLFGALWLARCSLAASRHASHRR